MLEEALYTYRNAEKYIFGVAKKALGVLSPRLINCPLNPLNCRNCPSGTTAAPCAARREWTKGRDVGITQMDQSFARMGMQRMDLMQVHNLQDWQTHLPVLREWQAAGKIRYIGLTTSTSRQYGDMEAVMRVEKLDFVRLNYSVGERDAENLLLPLARDKGIATLINRPFMRAELFSRVANRPLPGWATEIGCASWGHVFLKFILGHPASTKAANIEGQRRGRIRRAARRGAAQAHRHRGDRYLNELACAHRRRRPSPRVRRAREWQYCG
jgi:predicted oxidoreductase